MIGKVDINLLPDVKQQYIKSQRTKRLFIAGSFLVSAGCVGLVVLLFVYTSVVQQRHIDHLQDDIDEYTQELKDTPDVDKILTIQNQLNALPSLHDDKPAITRITSFLSVLVPEGVELNNVSINFEDSEMVISGSGVDFKAVNTFADTLKNAVYYEAPEEGQTVSDSDKTKAFPTVVLQEIGKSDEVSSFEITIIFDPVIFDNEVPNIALEVPSITSTQSELGRPQTIFNDELIPQETTQ